MAIFTGAGVAIVTPFHADGSVNYEKLDQLIDYHCENGTDSIIICGTTGESATMTEKEHIEVIKHTIDHTKKRIPVIAGTGSNSTHTAIELSKEAAEYGADGLLIVTPYYNKASQQGLFLHFNECARSTRLPVILYNVPSRTGVNIYPATYKRLSETENIVAVKEASGNFSQMAKIASLCKEDLAIYSGNDDQITSSLALGGKGVISVLSNLVPNETHAICTSYFRGNSEESDNLQLKYLELIEALFLDVNPIPVKQAMRAMGYDVGPCRLPLCDMDRTMAEKLYAVLEKYDLTESSKRQGSVTVHMPGNTGTVLKHNV
nr:4-hydroxy-tetrahydrodipicolinate synthase [uncultured Blautia sp.]